MKANIDVASRQEADDIRTGLEDLELRAMVKITAALAPLDQPTKIRVLGWINERLSNARLGHNLSAST